MHSKTCSTCSDLRSLYARSEASLRGARKLYMAALRAADLALLPPLEEELKQSAAARKIIGHTIEAHRARQHAPTLPVAA